MVSLTDHQECARQCMQGSALPALLQQLTHFFWPHLSQALKLEINTRDGPYLIKRTHWKSVPQYDVLYIHRFLCKEEMIQKANTDF